MKRISNAGTFVVSQTCKFFFSKTDLNITFVPYFQIHQYYFLFLMRTEVLEIIFKLRFSVGRIFKSNNFKQFSPE